METLKYGKILSFSNFSFKQNSPQLQIVVVFCLYYSDEKYHHNI